MDSSWIAGANVRSTSRKSSFITAGARPASDGSYGLCGNLSSPLSPPCRPNSLGPTMIVAVARPNRSGSTTAWNAPTGPWVASPFAMSNPHCS